ncbi:MAG: carboxylate--amine ligase [Myxococcota bacterium]
MNVVFISPHFPPQWALFCVALKNEGANVLGMGDTVSPDLRPPLSDVLADYAYVPHLAHYDSALRAMGYLVWRHGKIHRLDSLNEHWLDLEGALREDFNVPGPRREETTRNRSKMGMKTIFRAAEIPCAPGELVTGAEQVRRFAREHGLPLVFKPDTGVGAARTWKVSSEKELEEVLLRPLEGYIVEPFVQGNITSFDGLTDAAGRIVFWTSHVYSQGVMETVTHGLDVHYWSRRQIPAQLEALGRKMVQAFGIRERFFHAEFFEHPDGSFTALEINIRPPGGFTVDMMNYACDVDLYRLWARVVTGKQVEDFRFERKYHSAHVSRRYTRNYRHPHEELVRRLGETMVVHHVLPPIFSQAMGDQMYLLRHQDQEKLQEAIRLVETLG